MFANWIIDRFSKSGSCNEKQEHANDWQEYQRIVPSMDDISHKTRHYKNEIGSDIEIRTEIRGRIQFSGDMTIQNICDQC